MKRRRGFVTNSSSVCFIVSVAEEHLPELVDLLPEGWGSDYEVELHGIFRDLDDLPDKHELRVEAVTSAEDVLRQAGRGRSRKSLGHSWDEPAMEKARQALRDGQAVATFSLPYEYFELRPDDVHRVSQLAEVLASVG